ncbi:MAG: PEGA domain-containing protein, partial [Bradymonadaceae bacterium]
LFPNAAIYYRLGQTAERLNKPFEAVDHYEEFLALESTGETAQRVKARMPELRANLPARLELDSVPQGAEVHAATATGPERLGKTPLVVDRAVGELTIELTFPEHHPHRKTIELEAGTRIQTTIELQEIKPGEAEKVVTEARDRAPGIADAAREPSAVTGSDVVAAAPEPGERSDLSAWGWTATGLGVAVLATGGVFSYLQHSATEQANSYNKQKVNARPSELEGLKDDANSHYRTAMISYIAGGVITAGGIGLLVYSSMSDSSGELARDERRLKLGAGGDHQRAWLSVSGRF